MKSVTKLCQLSIRAIDQLAETTNLMKLQLTSFEKERENNQIMQNLIGEVRDVYVQ